MRVGFLQKVVVTRRSESLVTDVSRKEMVLTFSIFRPLELRPKINIFPIQRVDL